MFDNNPGLTASRTICLDWQTVSHALDLVEGFLHVVDSSDDVRAKLAIVVEELVANVVEHGACPDDQPIALTLAQQGRDIAVSLSDGGTYFDPRLVGPRTPHPPERGGGAGIALVLSWTRNVSYCRVDGRNLLQLVIPASG